MKRALLAGLLLGFLCYLRGRHGTPKRAPVMGGHRCSECGRPMDPDYVDPHRRIGPRRPGVDPRFLRRSA